ncbi:MAG TPA: hypothetical protein PLA90_01095 [Candidatus Sumerlaeota bacterium]|nr:hypothetical protein [Candidatus Sumerlaeota bacterium]
MGGMGLRNAAMGLGVALALAGCQSLSQPSQDNSASSILQLARWHRSESPSEEKKVEDKPQPPAPTPETQPTEQPPMNEAVNAMVQSLLASLNIAQMADEPCILLDPAVFPSEGLSPEEVEDLVGRLRIELNRAANGNVYFISPVQVDIQKAKGRSGYKYRLNGRFSATDSGGSTRSSHKLDLELRDTGGGAIWNGSCLFARE